MHVELEQLHVCHAYIKQARVEELSSGGGGVPTFRKNLTSPPPPKKRKPDKMALQYLFCISMVEI